MITLTIIFAYFYLKYLRRMIIKFKNRDHKDDSFFKWIEYEDDFVDIGIIVISSILLVVLLVLSIIFAIKYLP